ncbi:Stp1/IreP family PP2C-type Ser/Thr phosphatase [Eisenibacter elegans]|uniref:Stp1/IreP family PP2C-type Ser/Thr phosphatase n=1 Tax=Eisenibacter elegans TaxID=997 RepID=UPI0006879778|nr:Stp1/IreP family PP2C-type Ser/Thr phosphatase [Eisenibacter elegans]
MYQTQDSLPEKQFRFGNHTDVGNLRTQNEDYLGYFDTLNGHIFLVCDGMGGHAGGSTASQLAVSSIRNLAQQTLYPDTPGFIEKAIQYANSQIYKEAQTNPELRGMGTTCVMIVIRGNAVYYGHVGDSRLYYHSMGRLHRLTTDDSFVQELVNRGMITDDEARTHPRRNEILKALGTHPTVEVSVGVQPIIPFKDDIFLLCTDGLNGPLSDNQIGEVLNQPLNIQHKALQLVQMANHLGGEDNITVQLVEFFNAAPTLGQVSFANPQQQTAIPPPPLDQTQPEPSAQIIRPQRQETPQNPIIHKKKATTKPETNSNTQRPQQNPTQRREPQRQQVPRYQQPNTHNNQNTWDWDIAPSTQALGILSLLAVVLGFVYFSDARPAIQKRLYGVEQMPVSYTDSLGITRKLDPEARISKRVERRILNYAVDNSSLLRWMFSAYVETRETVEKVNNVRRDIDSTLNNVRQMGTQVQKGLQKLPFNRHNQKIENIADQYGISLRELMELNKVSSLRELRRLDSLVLPEKANPRKEWLEDNEEEEEE